MDLCLQSMEEGSAEKSKLPNSSVDKGKSLIVEEGGMSKEGRSALMMNDPMQQPLRKPSPPGARPQAAS